MNIGICCYPSYGGSGVVATELGMQLAQRGHVVHFIAHKKPFRLGHFHPNIFYHEVEVPNYPVFVNPPYLMAMANTIKLVDDYYGLDVLHAHYAVPHAAAIWMAREMIGKKTPLVTTLHGTDITLMAEEPNLKEINLFSVKQSDVVTVVSKSLGEQTLEVVDVRDRIKLIYNFIDESQCVRIENSNLRERLGIGRGQKILMHTSNFRAVKRVCDIVRVFAEVSKNVDSKLILIGEGPELCGARRRVSDMGLEDNVVFLGNQSEVMELLSLGDVFILPSEKESFGLAALEAMACGTPVVASDTGGLPELVLDGVTGYTCPVGDVSTMSERVMRLFGDRELWTNMSRAGQERAKSVFSAEAIVPEYIKIYEHLLHKIGGETR